MAEYKIERKANKARKKANRRRVINQDIIKVAVFFAVAFFAMAIFLGKFLAFDAGAVVNNTYNKRTENLKKTVLRGAILSRYGDVLAYSEEDAEGNQYRVYPYGYMFAHVVGFEDHGGLGLESSYNYYLLSSHESFFTKVANEFIGVKTKGDSIVTTLDTGLQQKLCEILQGIEGAIVVVNPQNGEILGMASNPDFDPNYIDAEWESIVNDPESSILLNRVTQATFTPGSTFKIFTLLEYYREHGGNIDSFAADCSGSIDIDGNVLSCVDGEAHGYQNLRESFANSCNVAFSQIGLSLNITKFAENNETLLFNKDLGIDIATKPSSFSLSGDSSTFMTTQTTFGQGETLVSPMHLAMVTSAVANGGTLMKPHLVQGVITAEQNGVKAFAPEKMADLMTPEEAAFMKDCMRAVVTEGTGIILSYDGDYISYGKTGTAETASDKEISHDHSWFTGFAENNGTTIVVCAMIENAQEAGMTGVYAAKQVFDYYFN